MARIRTLKPEWLEDEKLAALPDAARVLSVGLILLADDQGRGRANPALLAGHVWPYHTTAKAAVELARLAEAQFVILYTVAGQQYYQIRNWDKHQRVDHPAAPRLPGPEHSNGHGAVAAVPIPEKLPKASRGSRRAPADFELTEERLAFAIGDGMDQAQAEREFAKFKDCEFKTPRSDWDAAWRNWVRTCTQRQNMPPPRSNGPPPSRPQPDAYKPPDTREEREWRKNYLAKLGANVKDVP